MRSHRCSTFLEGEAFQPPFLIDKNNAVEWLTNVKIPDWRGNRHMATDPHENELAAITTGSTPLEQEILVHMDNLGNQILASASSKALSRLKSNHPEVFCDRAFYSTVMKMHQKYHYRMAARRFVHDLFGGIEWSAETLPHFTPLDDVPNYPHDTSHDSIDASQYKRASVHQSDSSMGTPFHPINNDITEEL